MRIVLGDSSLASYGKGGGHWSVYLQYLLGLRALGHDVSLLELLPASGDTQKDDARAERFFQHLARYGLEHAATLLVVERASTEEGESRELVQDVERARVIGASLADVRRMIRDADALWNPCCGIRQPLLGMFRRRVLIDLDPGHLQVSALTWGMDLQDHDAFFTVGTKLNDADCEVPRLGVSWQTFLPFVHLPMWSLADDPGPASAFSSITHWSWGELWWEGRVLGLSKRDGYLSLAGLPERVGRPFELAVRFKEDDASGDREALAAGGWTLSDPWQVAASAADYQEFISGSRAEISCTKPIFRELRTGWFSDRSAGYLASGRPVLAQDTGFSERLPVGEGLLCFSTPEEAAAAVGEIDANYERHRRAARALAEDHLDARGPLTAMVEASA
jgi:hypothetical protein